MEALPYGGRILLEPGRHWIDATINLFKPIEIMGMAAAEEVQFMLYLGFGRSVGVAGVAAVEGS